MSSGQPRQGEPDPARGIVYQPFRPRATRIVSRILIVWIIVGYVVFVVLTQRLDHPPHHYQWVGAVLALAICLFLNRQAEVKAVPSREGLMVQNVIRRHFLDWPQIFSVRFGDRDWVQLDLSDGSVLAVMAIQRVDGVRAVREASRLAALVARNEPGGVDSSHPRG